MKKIFAFNFSFGELSFSCYSRWDCASFYFLKSDLNAFFRGPGYSNNDFYSSKNLIKVFKTV